MMKIVRLTENDLHRMVGDTVKKILRESFGDWNVKNDSLYVDAVNAMTNFVLGEIDIDILANAVDLNECNSNEVEQFLYIFGEENEPFEDESFSIKKYLANHKYHNEYLPIIENLVEENYQDMLSDDLLEAIYDRYDVASVINKKNYGGGGYEVIRQFAIDVKNNVIEKIKTMK